MVESSKQSVQLVTIDAEFAGQRLDNFLVTALKGAPKSLIYRIIRKGEVRINKGRTKPEYKLQAGDVVRVPPLRLSEDKVAPLASGGLVEHLEAAILFEDDYLMVVNKPTGLAVHGGSGVSLGLIEAVRQMRPDAKRLELVHRLDRETSGAIMIAKRRSALLALNEALAAKQGVEKKYLALVYGSWSKGDREISAPLLKNQLQSGERIVRVNAEGKKSLTRFRIVESFQDYTLVSAEPVTGRTHQIRVHCQFAGHSIVGDDKYAADEQLAKSKSQGARRLFLHAYRLAFRHPGSGQLVEIEAPYDDVYRDFLAGLKK